MKCDTPPSLDEAKGEHVKTIKQMVNSIQEKNSMLQEKDSVIQEKDSKLQQLAQMLLENGFTKEQIFA